MRGLQWFKFQAPCDSRILPSLAHLYNANILATMQSCSAHTQPLRCLHGGTAGAANCSGRLGWQLDHRQSVAKIPSANSQRSCPDGKKINENPWNQWKSMKINENPWKSMKVSYIIKVRRQRAWWCLTKCINFLTSVLELSFRTRVSSTFANL